MTSPLLAQEPAPLSVEPGKPLPSHQEAFPNQQIANAIADQLRQSGQLNRYTVDITFRDATAELSGTVADQPQREEVLRIAQGVPGVEKVIDHLTVVGDDAITPAQASAPPAAEPPALPTAPPPPAVPAPAGATPAEPMPIFQAPPLGPYDVNQPKMPPYAWPTYAPYNNYSRVAYPEAYPYNAWPYIGPLYPFPKIPLGWRSVQLEWQDGYWWFSKVATRHDWWRIRYW
jgi:hypothetical protein